jgi:uncharacterized protein (TIGR02145 family)
MKKKNRFLIYPLIVIGVLLMLQNSCKKSDDNNPLPGDTKVTDIDGNIYTTVTIGTQVWMKENLKTTKYNDGTAIPNVTVNSAWEALTTGAYCDYNNTPSNSTTYGRLYNWYAVDNNPTTKVASNGGKNVCPIGWHVPNDSEWTALVDYLTTSGYNWDGTTIWNRVAKSMASTSGWTTSGTLGEAGNDQASNNRSGFTALPSGGRGMGGGGTFVFIESNSYWWSSSEYSTTNAYTWFMAYNLSFVDISHHSRKHFGNSVRCLRD